MKNKKERKAKPKDMEDLKQAFIEIQMPRPPYVLENLVVNTKFTDEQRYAQCVLELSNAYDNLRSVKLLLEKKQLEINEIDTSTRIGQIDKEIKEIEMEQTNRAVIGAMREFDALYEIWLRFPKRYTREELNAAQPEEYLKMLTTQAQHDLNATGRVTQGNQEGLRQIGRAPYPELDVVREVEKKYLETGKQKILIGVPTEVKAIHTLACVDNILFPSGCEIKLYNCWGRQVDDAYNNIVEQALNDKADYIFTVEDDTFPTEDALVQLMQLIRKHPRTAVGAWYPKKEKNLQGTPIYAKNGKRQALQVDGEIHEVLTLPMGCSLYPIEMFMEIPYPWFKTTPHLSQDSFFSQLARDHGWKLLVDTNIRCKHVDRITKEVFQYEGDIGKELEVKKEKEAPIPALQVAEELDEMVKYVTGKKLILEIGTALGGTLVKMINAAADDAEFISIDLPNGPYGGEFGQPDMKEMFSWLREKQKMHIIRDNSKAYYTVKKVEEILNGRKFDFILIDGDHSYQGVKEDYEIYKNFAEDIIAFHDIAINADKSVGVKKLWDEIEGNKKEIIFDPKQGWAGIGILKV